MNSNFKIFSIEDYSGNEVEGYYEVVPFHFFKYHDRAYFIGKLRLDDDFNHLVLGFMEDGKIYWSQPRRQCRFFDRNTQMELI